MTDNGQYTPTALEYDEYLQKLLNKLKQDPQFELRQEFGRMLMRHINTFSDDEMKRFKYLEEQLKQPTP